jgi:hypothetical protein
MTNNQTNTNSVPEGYLEKNQQQNFTQKSEKKNFFQTKRFKTILASMLIILSFGIIGVTALETVGPEEYRISNAFGLNSGTQDEDNNENEINSFEECVEAEGVILESFPEQCSINGQTFTRELTDEEKAMLEEQNNQTSAQPLVADDNYDVVVIEECDLAVRYGKVVNDPGFRLYNGNFDMKNYIYRSNLYTEIEITPDQTIDYATGAFPYTTIDCFDKSLSDGEFLYRNAFEGAPLPDLSEADKDKSYICEFMTDATCDLVQNLKVYEEGSPDEYGYTLSYSFDLGDKRFVLYDIEADTYQHPDLVIQLNSLAPSTASVNTSTEVTQSEESDKSAQPRDNTLQMKIAEEIILGDTSCNAVVGMKTYTIPNDSDWKDSMSIVTPAQASTVENGSEAYQNVKDLVNGQRDYVDADGLPDWWSLYGRAFNNSCSGFGSSKYMSTPQVNLPGADRTRVIYALEGQDVVGHPTVRIFAYKGDNIIMIQGSPYEFGDLDNLANSCGAQGEFDDGCYLAKLQSPEVVTAMDQKAQELVNTFALK